MKIQSLVFYNLLGLVTIVFLIMPVILFSDEYMSDTLIVTNSNSWAPFSYINEDGDPDGLLIEFWYLFSVYNNVNIKFDLTSWNESLKKIKNNEADIHGGLFRDSEREEYMLFTNPLDFSLETRLFSRKQISFDELITSDTVYVGIVKGDYIENYFRNHYPNLQIHSFETSKDVIYAAAYGKINCFALDFPSFIHHVNSFPTLKEFYSTGTLVKEYLRFGITIENKHLQRFVNEGIGKIPESKIKEIVSRRIQYEEKTPEWLFSFIVSMIILSLISFIVLYVVLLKKNEMKLRYLVNIKTSELKEKNDELMKALEEVKTLSGILPICSNCKRIKDSKGYWNQVESYITNHSDAQFSHGLCESCAKKLYGEEDWFKELEKEDD